MSVVFPSQRVLDATQAFSQMILFSYQKRPAIARGSCQPPFRDEIAL